MTEEPLSPQVSLHGRNAWVVRRLAEERGEGGAKGDGTAKAVAWIVDQWIDSDAGRVALRDRYGIDPKDYTSRNRVVQHPSAAKRQ